MVDEKRIISPVMYFTIPVAVNVIYSGTFEIQFQLVHALINGKIKTKSNAKIFFSYLFRKPSEE